MTKTALYPGSFDPFTNGHLDILLQALEVADHVVIAIGVHAAKSGMFTFEERKVLIKKVFSEYDQSLGDRISIAAFDNLVVDAARELNATLLIRGLRDSTDLNYEMQMAGMNGAMAPDIQTIFLPASPDSRPITATLVRQIAKMGGDVSSFVPVAVADALTAKFAE